MGACRVSVRFWGVKMSPWRVNYPGQTSAYKVSKPAETYPFEVRFPAKTYLGR
jgi:hypothetical protein